MTRRIRATPTRFTSSERPSSNRMRMGLALRLARDVAAGQGHDRAQVGHDLGLALTEDGQIAVEAAADAHLEVGGGGLQQGALLLAEALEQHLLVGGRLEIFSEEADGLDGFFLEVAVALGLEGLHGGLEGLVDLALGQPGDVLAQAHGVALQGRRAVLDHLHDVGVLVPVAHAHGLDVDARGVAHHLGQALRVGEVDAVLLGDALEVVGEARQVRGLELALGGQLGERLGQVGLHQGGRLGLHRQHALDGLAGRLGALNGQPAPAALVSPQGLTADSLLGLPLAEAERRLIEATLALHGGSIPKAARVLDV
ncbi:MAG: helix-turn-helix domain-containing protein, partial [Candidatus Sericytochromatia bacterium]